MPEATSHFAEAEAALDLSQQERNLYQLHLTNLYGSGGVDNPDGSRSTLYQAVVEGPDGRSYSIPTVWNGRILPPAKAAQMAAQSGWDKWPSYSSPEEADARYDRMHRFMDRDTSDFFAQRYSATAIDPILQTRKPTDLPEPITQAVRGGLQILGEEAEHVFGLPQAIMEQSELLRTTGEYNPAPMVELLSLGAGGGMGAAEKDAIGVFGGRAWARDTNFLADPKARKFVPPGSSLARERKYRPAYDAALLMEQAGKSREEIFDETGWFRGHEGKWKFEISDKDAKLIQPPSRVGQKTASGETITRDWENLPQRRSTQRKLADVLDHPKLFEQYPDLADMPLKWGAPPRSASYTPFSDTGYLADEHISLDPDDPDLLSRILHEVTHAIQAREGFAPGGNKNELKLVWEAEKAHKKFPGSASPYDLAYEAYMRHAGEVEARNVQHRRFLEELAGNAGYLRNLEDINKVRRELDLPERPPPNRARPWETEDRPSSKMIFREPHERPPRIRLTPVKGDPFAPAAPITSSTRAMSQSSAPTKQTPQTFAERVNQIASQLKTPPFQDRVSIADVYDKYGYHFPDAGSLASFKARLIEAQQKQELFLDRLDMPERMGKEMRSRSETPTGEPGYTVHFISKPPEWSKVRWPKRQDEP